MAIDFSYPKRRSYPNPGTFYSPPQRQTNRYKYQCYICKVYFKVYGFNPTKCEYCKEIVCLSCLHSYRIPPEYKPKEPIKLCCDKCQRKAELSFIERIKDVDLLLHVNRKWCSKIGEKTYFQRLGIL